MLRCICYLFFFWPLTNLKHTHTTVCTSEFITAITGYSYLNTVLDGKPATTCFVCQTCKTPFPDSTEQTWCWWRWTSSSQIMVLNRNVPVPGNIWEDTAQGGQAGHESTTSEQYKGEEHLGFPGTPYLTRYLK